jgi:hypothetical protein
MTRNAKIALWSILALIMVGIVIVIVFTLLNKTEGFVKGYDALYDGCIQKCEMDLLRRNPYFVQLQEGWEQINKYCIAECGKAYQDAYGKCARDRLYPHKCNEFKFRAHQCV